jgi:hypothetical protein
MGVTTGLATPAGTFPPDFLNRFGNRGPRCASNLMSYQVLSLPTGLPLNIAAAWPQCLGFLGTPLVIEPSPGQLSGDAGLQPGVPIATEQKTTIFAEGKFEIGGQQTRRWPSRGLAEGSQAGAV